MNTPNKFDVNNYQFNKESRDGIYIIHGFTNTTYEVKELAIYLSKQGYYTRADNLPGHGTSPEDCNRCKYSDWIEFVEQGMAEMISRCDNIYVIGISMGSLLALHLSSIFPLNAAVYASIAIKFKDKIRVRILTPLFHRIIPFHQKKYSYPKYLWDNFEYIGYSVWPLSAVNEMRKLTNYVSSELSSVTCPSLLIHSNADKLTLKENIEFVYQNISSEQKETFFIENATHNIFIPSPDRELIFEKVASFLKQFWKG